MLFLSNLPDILSVYRTLETKFQPSMRYSLLLFLFVFCASSCGDKNQIVVKNDAGVVVEKYAITNDSLKNGLYEAFYDDGTLKETCNYVKGSLQGERKMFFSNGNLEITENYVDGKMNGEYKNHYESGQLMLHMNFENGTIQGESLKYHENGNLAEKVQFVSGEENGPFEEYHENGVIHWKGNYFDGDNEVGLLEEYDLEGTLIKKMMCDSNSICRTIWTVEEGDIVPKY